jgi:LysM repeat protein
MRRWKSLFYFLLLNILVSAGATLLVLRWWESRSPAVPVAGTPIVIRLTANPADAPAAAAAPQVETALQPPASMASDPLLPTTTVEVIAYIVQLGDTLGTISADYQVSLADLLAVNQIDNPDQLYVGQTIYIPTGPLPTQAPPPTATPPQTATPTTTPSPTSGPALTATPTLLAQPAGMQIVTVVGAGDLNREHVVLERTGSGPLALAGWQLVGPDRTVYTFPRLTLFEGGAVNVYTRLGQDTVIDLYWGLGVPAWQSGDTVTLIDAQGVEQASFTIP